MSLFEVLACNSETELTDWLGGKIGALLDAHAKHMVGTLPMTEEIPLHPFMATGLARMILEDVNKNSEFNISEPIRMDTHLTADGENKMCFGSFSFPLEGIGWTVDLNELVQLARA